MKSTVNISYSNSKVSPDWKLANLTEARKRYVTKIVELSADADETIDLADPTFSRKQLKAVSLAFKDNDDVPNWIVKDHDRRASLGVYFIPEVVEQATGTSPLDSMLSSNTVVFDDTDDSTDDSDVMMVDDDFGDDNSSYTDDEVMAVVDSMDMEF